jgi:crotonobetainyl-CoA:carnitine CoA-transferase CaiB-like acyl-CoA transferase
MDDPQFQHRFHWYPAAQTVAETLDFPLHVTGEGPVDVRRAPNAGEHTDDVLTSVLGCPADRIAALRAAGVFGDE